ncbi:YchJ family protein [Klenkia sesuvii]|uniref:YchJ family protein n=1 Tax=Klenkia sesuvii TaxID=3103137 RepID=UPI003D786C94
MPAPTAEALMRSRYSAFVVGDPGYLVATWHPDTRPPSLELDEDIRWTGLDILDVQGGGLLAAEGVVEFRASHRRDGRPGIQQERSRFTKVGGRWHYLDGVATG